MVIAFGSTVLASGANQGPVGVRLNGAQITDDASLFRAVAATWYARANKSSRFEFESWWFFNTRGLCEAFILSHFASLPTNATLAVTCGDGEATQYAYSLAGAVLQGADVVEYKGTSVRMRYGFAGGTFAGQSITPTATDVVINGTVALSSGQTSQAVVFASSFGVQPSISVQIQRPTTAADSVPDWDAPVANISTAGFTAVGQAIPASGYVLHWEAFSPI